MALLRRTLLRRSLLAVAAASLPALPARAQTAESVDYGPAEWLRIPRIDVSSKIEDVGITDGYYDVPWNAVGRHFDSAQPGQNGNSIYTGHVDTINAGRVFARLKEVTPGDAVYVYTPGFRLDWVVVDVFTVKAYDDSFLYSYDDMPQVTLYTCAGQYNPLEQSFEDRLVVVGYLVQSVPRA